MTDTGGTRRNRLVVMVKAPIAGRVKTRLARAIGGSAATAFYRHTAHAVIRRLARDPRWHTILAVAPDVARDAPYWPAGISRMPQGSGDLGARMQRLIETAPPGPVLVIGTDIPAVMPAHIAAAFACVRRFGTVFGPADDGGFWLVGQCRTPSTGHYFDGVRWSTEHALADCISNLGGNSHALAAPLSDVDTAAEYETAAATSGRVIFPATAL